MRRSACGQAGEPDQVAVAGAGPTGLAPIGASERPSQRRWGTSSGWVRSEIANLAAVASSHTRSSAWPARSQSTPRRLP